MMLLFRQPDCRVYAKDIQAEFNKKRLPLRNIPERNQKNHPFKSSTFKIVSYMFKSFMVINIFVKLLNELMCFHHYTLVLALLPPAA